MNPPTVISQKVEKKSKIIFFILSADSMLFLRFCLCNFESGTVKSDCPLQENYEDLIQTVG